MKRFFYLFTALAFVLAMSACRPGRTSEAQCTQAKVEVCCSAEKKDAEKCCRVKAKAKDSDCKDKKKKDEKKDKE